MSAFFGTKLLRCKQLPYNILPYKSEYEMTNTIFKLIYYSLFASIAFCVPTADINDTFIVVHTCLVILIIK